MTVFELRINIIYVVFYPQIHITIVSMCLTRWKQNGRTVEMLTGGCGLRKQNIKEIGEVKLINRYGQRGYGPFGVYRGVGALKRLMQNGRGLYV